MNTVDTGHEPYDVHAKLEDAMGVLAIALGQWEERDDSRPQPEVRQAANTAMDAIDAMLGELPALRVRLMSDFRASNDAASVWPLHDLDDEDDENEPYCNTCGSPLGHFIGHGDDWHHLRGAGTPDSPVELYNAGHAPVVARRPAGTR